MIQSSWKVENGAAERSEASECILSDFPEGFALTLLTCFTFAVSDFPPRLDSVDFRYEENPCSKMLVNIMSELINDLHFCFLLISLLKVDLIVMH